MHERVNILIILNKSDTYVPTSNTIYTLMTTHVYVTHVGKFHIIKNVGKNT